MIDNFEKAKILNQALPYIREFQHKIMVIKVGGSVLDEENSTFIHDLVLMKLVGIKVVVVHGGGKHISKYLNKLGKPTEFIDGLRVTDQESMEVTQMVLAGLVNKNMVSYLQQAGGNAVGLSGKDAEMVLAKPVENKQLGLVGDITAVNLELVNKLIEDSYIPVISSIASDGEKGSLNVNADQFATEIAIALKAEKLIFISDVLGLLKNSDDESSLISKIQIEKISEMINNQEVSGGMIPKLQSAKKSIESGIRFVHFLSGKTSHSLLVELFTDEGIGTQIRK